MKLMRLIGIVLLAVSTVAMAEKLYTYLPLS